MTQRLNPTRIGIYSLLILFSLIFLIPVYVMLNGSLKSFTEVQDLSKMWSVVEDPTLESFRSAWFGIPEQGLRGLGPNLINSIKLTIPATIISAMLGSMNGYILSKWKFPGADIIFPLMLFGMFIPYQAILVPLTITLAYLHLGGTLWGLQLRRRVLRRHLGVGWNKLDSTSGCDAPVRPRQVRDGFRRRQG